MGSSFWWTTISVVIVVLLLISYFLEEETIINGIRWIRFYFGAIFIVLLLLFLTCIYLGIVLLLINLGLDLLIFQLYWKIDNFTYTYQFFIHMTQFLMDCIKDTFYFVDFIIRILIQFVIDIRNYLLILIEILDTYREFFKEFFK